MKTTRSHVKRLLIILMGIILVTCFHVFISNRIDFVKHTHSYFHISDYTYHIILVKEFWLNGFGNIYDLSYQQQAISDYVGSQIYTVMPLGITPLALIVWFPFAYVSQFSMAFSYTLWVAFSMGVLVLGLWCTGRSVFGIKNQQLLPMALILCTLFSATTQSAVLLGQTSILATGLLVSLIGLLHQSGNETRTVHVMIICLIILALGIKPPYIALGLGLLLIYGLWQPFFYSLLLFFLVIIGITPVLTSKWISSYLNLLKMYSWGDFPNAYAWSIKLETMNIFRSAFKGVVGDGIASFISNMMYFLVYIMVIGLSIFTNIFDKSIEQLSRVRVDKDQLFILLVASYLLFAPNVGRYEDVLFISVFVTVMLCGDSPKLTNYKSLMLFFMLFFILNHRFLSMIRLPWLPWICKAVILGFMFRFSRFLLVRSPAQS